MQTKQPWGYDQATFLLVVALLIGVGFFSFWISMPTFNASEIKSAKFWVKPTTQGGWLVTTADKANVNDIKPGQRASRITTFIHLISRFSIILMTGNERVWPVFLGLLAVSGGLLWRRLRKIKITDDQYWNYRFLFLGGALGTAGHLALAPISTNLFIVVVSALGYGVGVLTMVKSFPRTFNPHADDPNRQMQYGPIFREPYLNGSTAMMVANYSRDVLPEASRWASKTGEWPVELPFRKISSGITILGEKGSGKSRLMFAMHDELRSKYPDTPILVHDPKGEWYRTYFDKHTDVLFGPHIEGSSSWDVWADLKDHPEMLHGIINTAVYAHPSNGDTFWLDNAVGLLENAFSAPSLDEARSYLIAKKEANIDDKMFLSIYGTAKLALRDIVKVALTKPDKGSPSRIDDYLRWKGRIILLNNPAFAAEQRGSFNLFLSAFLLRALSLPDLPSGQIRLVAFIDEALTFSLPPEIEKLIYTQSRSKGIVIVAGAQRLPERENREMGEWATAEYMFAMKVLSLNTQAQLSKRAGEIAYHERTSNRQWSQEGHRGESEGTQPRTHAAIPPETFGRLGNRECFLFHDEGITPAVTVRVNREQRDIPLPGYLVRPDVVEFMKKLD